ncbi:MAG: methylenetetrahydrofolate reductase [Actinomycetota bacterium]|nr:methylenetetrahydrofolate reductase [Actinomycetota bacterium]
MIRAGSRLERILHQGTFAVTAEVVPPRSADGSTVTAQARALVGYADAVNVTDNPTGAAHMSPVAGSHLVAAAGLEPVLQLTTRDRNRLGLTGDLLGGWALGARNVLCLTGDPPGGDDRGDTRSVFDLTVLELIGLAARLRDEGRLLSGAEVDPAPRYFIGAADLPLARPYDPNRLEQKADAGADFVQTQIVLDVDAFGEWAESIRPRGIFERMFLLVGVAPPRSAKTARFMRDHLPGVVVPDSLIAELEAAGPRAEEVGVRLTVDILAKLRAIPGVAGVHVMGLGQEDPVRKVIEGAGLHPRPAFLPQQADRSGQ